MHKLIKMMGEMPDLTPENLSQVTETLHQISVRIQHFKLGGRDVSTLERWYRSTYEKYVLLLNKKTLKQWK